MKRNFAVIMALLLTLLTLCACANTSEKIAEKMIEGMTGQKVDIDDGGNSVTIKGDDGESITVSTSDGQKWPEGKLGDLPELKGRVTSVAEAGGTCVVYMEDVREADAKAYIEKLKDMGYADGGEFNGDDGMMTFSGTKEGYEVGFSYYPEGGSGAGMSSVSIAYASKQ